MLELFFFIYYYMYLTKNLTFWLFILLCIILSLISRLSWFDKMVITKRFFFTTEKIQQKLENGPSSVSNALTVEDSSANNTPTHSRHPSDVPTMGSLQPTPENPAPKPSSELFSGFVIGVHRKMVCTFYYNNVFFQWT